MTEPTRDELIAALRDALLGLNDAYLVCETWRDTDSLPVARLIDSRMYAARIRVRDLIKRVDATTETEAGR